VEKDDARVEAYGSVDELNSALGVARAAGLSASLDDALGTIQDDLLRLGAELATAPGQEHLLTVPAVSAADATRLEALIDEHEALLPPLAHFILPGGSPGAAALHHARTICRRSERRVISAQRESAPRLEVVIYLNRLSDLLFVFARRANQDAGVSDREWQGRGR
jgi:cob(I)alamin adenosyltransferase